MTEPRTYTVTVTSPLISSNDRHHWARHAGKVRAIRTEAGWAARGARLPRMDRVRIVGELRFRDMGRRRDPANWAPSAKAAVDGLVDAGVLADDDHTRVTGPDMRLGTVPAEGAPVMLLHITEAVDQ